MKQSAERNTFSVHLGKAYYEMGFFNVGVKEADKFGPDGAEILVRLGKNGRTITATINRRANSNATPRVMCGTAYRDWVQKTYQMGDSFSIDVLSPLSLELY